jgi:hypothetical protein
MDNQRADETARRVAQFWAAPNEALFAQKEIAPAIKKSEAWCERARICGGGPKFLKLGRGVAYRKADVVAWIDRHTPVGSTSEYQARAA